MKVVDASGVLISPPVWSDFQGADWDGRLRLDRPGSIDDLERNDLALHEGMRLVLYDMDADDKRRTDDLVAVGIVEWDAEEGRWVCAVNWDDVDHVSALSAAEQQEYRRYRPESIGQVSRARRRER
jgi:hypothetical protein